MVETFLKKLEGTIFEGIFMWGFLGIFAPQVALEECTKTTAFVASDSCKMYGSVRVR